MKVKHNTQIDLINSLNLFKNKKCVKAHIPLGSILYLSFGNLIFLLNQKTHPITNKIHLTTDYELSFGWNWNMISKTKIIASSLIENDKQYFHSLKQIEILKGKVLIDFTYNEISNDLQLFFEDGINLQTFNNIVKAITNNDLRNQDIFSTFTPNSIFRCTANGKVMTFKRNVEYVADFDVNPEKYKF